MATLADMFKLVQTVPEPIGMRKGRTDYGYGNRWDSDIPKQRGYYGEVRRPDGGLSGEISIGTDLGEIPTMVPGLTEAELRHLVTMDLDTGDIPESIIRKAINHAKMRRLQGLDPFATSNDAIEPLPRDYKLLSEGGLADMVR